MIKNIIIGILVFLLGVVGIIANSEMKRAAGFYQVAIIAIKNWQVCEKELTDTNSKKMVDSKN